MNPWSFQGGLRAVVWTDTFQTFVVMAGLIAVTVQGSIDVGGIDKVWKIAYNGGRISFLEYAEFYPLYIFLILSKKKMSPIVVIV